MTWRLSSSIVVVVVACAACGAETTVAPDAVQLSSIPAASAPGQDVTISGWIYAHTENGEPPIADGLVEVTSNSISTSTRSRADGSYAVTVAAGRVTITASKEGHASRTLRIAASKDVALSFGLPPL